MNYTFILVIGVLLFVGVCELQQVTSTVRGYLKTNIENINSNNAIYGLKDTYNTSMQCAKVIQISSSLYVAVYHFPTNGDFKVGIANSTDLVNWHQRSLLEFGSSQATVYAVGSGQYLMAWEQTYSGGNHIRIRYFKNLIDLMADHSDYTVDIPPPSWVSASIGTPNIFSASISSSASPSISTITIGAHYNSGNRDRQTSFIITNFNNNNIQWLKNPNTYFESIEDSVLYWLYQLSSSPGNIGGRDPIKHPNYTFFDYAIIEGNPSGTGNDSYDFGYWKCFLYDRQTHNSDILNFASHCGATAFANPHLTVLNLPNNGPRVLFGSLFIPSEGRGTCDVDTVTYYNLI